MVLCAAVKFYIEATKTEVVIPCRRHGDAFHILEDLGFKPKVGYRELVQGFITTTGEFLHREKAYDYAIRCGQLSATVRDTIHNGILFSEDLY